MSKKFAIFTILAFLIFVMALPSFAKFCPRCGQKNDDGNKFCVSCGYKFLMKNTHKMDKSRNVKHNRVRTRTHVSSHHKTAVTMAAPPDIRTSKNPEQRYKWGLYFLSKKKYSYAKDEFKEAVRLRPTMAKAYSKLGYSYMKLLILDKARLAYEKAIELNPENSEAYYNLGVLYRFDGDIYKERKYYLKAIKYDSKNRLALNNLAVNYIANQEEKKASRFLKRAIRFYPEYWIARNNVAVIFLFKRDVKKARESIIRAHDLNPDFYLSYYNMGVIYEKEQDYEEAIEMYRRCLKIKKEHFESRINLAALLRKENKLQEAKEILLNLVDEKPESAEAWLDLSLVYADLDMEDDSVDARNQASSINVDYASHDYDQGLTFGAKEFYDDGTYEPVRNKNPKYKMSLFIKENKALEEVDKISTYTSSREIKGLETAEERFALGSKMLKSGQIERAISDFKHAVKLNNGNYPEAFEAIGIAYGSKGEFKKSAKFLKIAYKQDSKSESILLNLEKAYGILKKYNEQINILNKLLKLNPDNSEAYYHMGMAYVKSKRYKKGVKYLRLFLEKDPDSIKKGLVKRIINKYKNR